jgi:ATP-dependent DNA helicase RecQ
MTDEMHDFELRDLNWKFEEAERLTSLPAAARGLYGQLWRMRRRLAEQEKIPPFRILTNKLILDLCEKRPLSFLALAAVPGIGITRLKKYGPALLSTMAEDQSCR